MKIFQTIVIELYKQPKEANRNYFSGLLISSIKVNVVDKTNDGVYVSSTFKMYSSAFHLFSLLCQTRSSCQKSWKWCSYFENHYYHEKNDREEYNEFFGQSLWHLVVFSRGKYQVFWSSFVSSSLQLPDQLPYDYVNLDLEILQRIFTCLWKRQLNHWTSYQAYKNNWLSPSYCLFKKAWTPFTPYPSVTFCQTNTVISTYTYKTLHRFKQSKDLTILLYTIFL